MADNYHRLVLANVHTDQEEALVQFCMEAGAEGVSEELKFEQTGDEYEPVTQSTTYHRLNVYFLKKPSEDFLAKLEARFPEVEVQLKEEPHRDWLEEWKKGFKPFELAPRYWVVPSWEKAPSQAQNIIRIDPGMAFGTGTHATTQLAARLMVKHLNGNQQSLLDVGTGTGILAMLAQQLGVSRIVATEIDSVAREVAKANVAANQSSVEVLDDQVESVNEHFHWVVANIIDGVLLKLQDHLVNRVRPSGGYLLLTGVLEEREKMFLEKWRHPYCLVERAQQDEWVGFLMEIGE